MIVPPDAECAKYGVPPGRRAKYKALQSWYDAESGKMKRFWGAYGRPPDDKAALAQGPYDPTVTYQHFRGPVHCADVSLDNLVYVCDRTSNRLQIFKPDGTFVN